MLLVPVLNFGMERFSLGKITKASTLSYQRVASLFRGQWKQYLATLPAFLTARELAGLSEYVVEGTQGLISDINQKTTRWKNECI